MRHELLRDPTKCVDHIDGDTLNNQRNNLRLCTRSDNARNRKSVGGSTSEHLGVYAKQPSSNGNIIYQATIGKRIGKDKKQVNIFTSNEQLHCAYAYNVAASLLWDGFTRPNNVPEEYQNQTVYDKVVRQLIKHKMIYHDDPRIKRSPIKEWSILD
jgi:hypothetical protein